MFNCFFVWVRGCGQLRIMGRMRTGLQYGFEQLAVADVLHGVCSFVLQGGDWGDRM